MKNTLINKDTKDLEKELADTREALRAFRFGAAGGKAKNAHEGKSIRKNIARVLTELSRRKKHA